MSSPRRQSPSRARRSAPPRRPSSNNTGVLCIGAGLVLVAAMGVTALKQEATATPQPAPLPSVHVSSTSPQPAAQQATRVRAVKPASPVSGLTKQVRAVEQRIREWPEQKRDSEFERQRIIALSELSEVREALDQYLQTTRDDQADRLWDRLQRVYVTVKKL